MMKNPGAVDQVEGQRAQRQVREIAFDEADPVQAIAARCRGAQREGLAREIAGDHLAIGTCEIEAHLAGTAADLRDARVTSDGGVEQASKGASFGAGAQPGQAVVGRITWKW